MAVYLALDLVLKHAAGLGQLTHHDEDLAAVDELAVLGTKRDLLTNSEFVCWHARYLARPALLPVLRGFLAPPGLLPLERVADLAFPSPASISRRMASGRPGIPGCRARQLSSSSINSGARRTPIEGFMPVAGLPRFFDCIISAIVIS
jgi:hypothetical protein